MRVCVLIHMKEREGVSGSVGGGQDQRWRGGWTALDVFRDFRESLEELGVLALRVCVCVRVCVCACVRARAHLVERED